MPRLAWTSLVIMGVMALESMGCLITERPDFQPTKATAPLLTNFSPPLSTIVEVPRKAGSPDESPEYVSSVTNLAFDLRSEDLQRPLYASVFIDFPRDTVFPEMCPFADDQLAPGTLDKVRRLECKVVVPPAVSQGCHSITALVSHSPAVLAARIDPNGDLATVTWWAQVGFDSSKRDFRACQTDLPPTDGGRDSSTEGGGL